MLMHSLMLALTIGAPTDNKLPPQPDFTALIPHLAARLPASERDQHTPALQEARLLARYLNRVWSAASSRDELSKSALDLLTITAQLDSALLELNPNPTVTEAVVRVRAYQAIIAVARHRLKLAETGSDEWKLESVPGRLGLDSHLHRFCRQIERNYGPLFKRVV
jgi:hypothetical protein